MRQMREHPGAERVEPAGLYGDVVEQKRVDDDPHHRPHREDGAVGDRFERERNRHLPGYDGDDQADDEAGERRLPCRPPQPAEKKQHDEDRQDGDQKRKPEAVAHRCQKLPEHFHYPHYERAIPSFVGGVSNKPRFVRNRLSFRRARSAPPYSDNRFPTRDRLDRAAGRVHKPRRIRNAGSAV